ncbi:alpha/beta hydrolase [Sphingomonas oligophenolica]|uniref:Alpha/beta hydrolase n=1 Tax=Sphingomonas oligophenolica TaxID=301154 RepID=A0ABU9Y7D3_9SPHN
MGFDISRRAILGGGALFAVTAGCAKAVGVPSAAGDEIVRLWPDAPPGDQGRPIHRKIEERSQDVAHPDRWVTGIDRPVLIVRRPANPNGAGVLVVPGGSYSFLAYDNEGTEQARWLNERGVTAFILQYRLPGEGWSDRADVPLQDAQRAMRVIRAGAAGFAVRPDRIAVLGFSAGGHLAGSLATRHADPVYAAIDSTDRLSARPDVAGLIYPVISMEAPFTHGGSRDNLLGADAPAAQRRAFSVEHRVTAATPPMFIVHASDDGLVPVANSLALYNALLDAKRPAELHVFDEGGHGFGARLPRAIPTAIWPSLFAAFAARKGIFPSVAA